MGVLNPLLPKRYAPLQANGAGLQSVYLTRVPENLAAALIDLLGAEAHDLVLGYRVAEELPIASAVGLIEWEEHALSVVQGDATLPDTQRQAIVLARRGQGLFKKRVMTIEHACRITASTARSICARAIASRGGTQATRSGWTARTDSF